MQTFEDYKKSRDESVSLLRDLAQKLRVLGGESKARTMIQVAEELNNNDFRIIFCGEFKRGKSTLINAILGQKALPMKVVRYKCISIVLTVYFLDAVRIDDSFLALFFEPLQENVDVRLVSTGVPEHEHCG